MSYNEGYFRILHVLDRVATFNILSFDQSKVATQNILAFCAYGIAEPNQTTGLEESGLTERTWLLRKEM